MLAAGAGRRMGGPKSLLIDPAGRPWLQRAADVVRDAGIDDVVVVLGAAPQAAELLAGAGSGARPRIVIAERWHEGPDASLAAGLATLAELAPAAEAAVVTLVDLPDVSAEVVRRVVDAVGAAPDALGRAVYAGRPGHPVVLGRDHWMAAPRSRRDLLAGPGAVRVECIDLASGADLDHPGDVPPGTTRADIPAAGASAGDLPPTNRS